MATTYHTIEELYAQTIARLCENPEDWLDFLSSASRNYKLPFTEQVLIYAQRPDVTAVLTLEDWNSRFGRWINKGSIGIAVFGEPGKSALRYYFDISDTHESKRSIPVPLWDMKEEYEDSVANTLQVSFGDFSEEPIPFEEILENTALTLVADNHPDYLSALFYSRTGSRLAGLEHSEVKRHLIQALCPSVAYGLSTRCGQRLNEINFEWLEESLGMFNTLETMNILGCAASDISEMALREIATTVYYCEKDQQTHNRRVDESSLPSDNQAKQVQETERSTHGDSLRKSRRTPSSEPHVLPGQDSEPGSVRTDEVEIFEGTQESSLHESTDSRQARSPLKRDRQSSGRDDGAPNKTDDGSRGSYRESQADRSDALGGTDEQYQSRSKADSDEGDYLQLEPPLNTLVQSLGKEAAVEKPAAFFIDDTVLNKELVLGSGFENGKFRIFEQYKKNLGAKANIVFLKQEYGIGGHSAEFAGTRGFISHDSQGLHFAAFDSDDQSDFSWKILERRLHELIALERYLTPLEKEKYETWQESKSSLQESVETVLKQADKISVPLLPLGSPVFIGSIEYELIEQNETSVTLFDPTSPLFPTEMSLSEFAEKFAENPLNLEAEPLFRDVQVEAPKSESITPEPSTASFVPAEKESETQTLVNFKIVDDALGIGTAKERLRWNIDAIRTLQILEAEKRYATPDEQETLARYVGFGSLPQAFDENAGLAKERAELKGLLSDEEYTAARASTLNAHYTSPVVIKSIYQVLVNSGFTSGNMLEPACGTGNFFGLLPEEITDANLFGVELDPLTARIATQLYQKADIRAQGFEEADFPENFFDVAIGNVPFGSYSIADKRYDKHKFMVHDYFFARTLDSVRPGGVVAFITSKGTLDKQNPSVRKYLAERAELLGAIRLPNTAFEDNAGTKVTADIIFLQKRDRPIVVEPSWVHLGLTEDGIPLNSYFAEHPDMVLGTMSTENAMHYGRGNETTCAPFEDAELSELLRGAVLNIHAEIADFERDDLDEIDASIPADPSVRNYSYTAIDDKVYFRIDSKMHLQELSKTATSRVTGMIAIRDTLRDLIELQTEDAPDTDIEQMQARLNLQYDNYTKKYGIMNSRGNATAFSQDSSYPLLCALENLDDEGNFKEKADMFSKRTIRPYAQIVNADTPTEALAVSLSERASVDIDYMAEISGLGKEHIVKNLEGVIFRDPESSEEEPVYLTADEYLSGNVRTKLRFAEALARSDSSFEGHVEALKQIVPKDLDASEISVRLGATWVPVDDVQEFMFELLETPYYSRYRIKVNYSAITANWNIAGKSSDNSNVKAVSTFGTHRANAYRIIEDTLNLRDTRIFDYVEDADGKRTAVLNKKETAIALSKQELIKEAFKDWIFKDPERRDRLVRKYNDTFNCTRLRTFDGSHLTFPGMNPEITLRKHQPDAVARIMYSGNTLLAHVVGAGKTFEIVAAAQEMKRIGLCSKSLIVVPNHLTEQWASEYLKLYPAANLLVSTKRDFETKNRKRFCARIATGDYDAVIIGHSQFEKIPVSLERQQHMIRDQIQELVDGIAELKSQQGEKFSIKQMEGTKKRLEARLKKLNAQDKKDDVITFEELGVDRLFIDESHYYKNLFFYTKMRNVGGIPQTEAQKSSDLFAKCRYLDEVTGGKGIIFATGTPISNSMVELYTVQRYLQYSLLTELNLHHFDCWASTFGETVTAIELAPEGTGYRQKTRFAKFYNLPELMSLFRQVADIQTADMLDLPTPKVNFHSVSVAPSEFQKELVQELSERADKVRNRMVEPTVDNMLRITNDGRKLALDQRLISDTLPDSDNSKVSTCCDNIYRIWDTHKEKRLTQLVFCDLSTPKADGTFSVYNEVRDKLTEKGVPESEIAFIHNADTEAKKAELFGKVRSGQIRILLGSTQKMGAGTNVQTLLVALHDLDCPWRPSDLQQRLGRIERQGNTNDEVEVFRYVTENTFDAYLYQLVENKQRFIGQIMTSKSPVRSAADVDETALSYAELKALATGNPLIKERMDLDVEVARLKLLKANHLSQKYALEDQIIKHYPQKIKALTERLEGYEADALTVKKNPRQEKDGFSIIIKGITYSEKTKAGAAILNACSKMTSPKAVPLGSYRGFQLELAFDSYARTYQAIIVGSLRHAIELGKDELGNIARLDNAIERIPEDLKKCQNSLSDTKRQMQNAQEEVEKPFDKKEELQSKTERLAELDRELDMDKENEPVLDTGESEKENSPKTKTGLAR